ncbi:hypothetical protein jhhlp_004233 [Lomentospora prolificans]|uniref:Pyridoxamine 5'-phosphate oxidase N-terminal domain-containing protein n=1 Tax=Lomentospora prolificans TaxID=41688 RepID=A0A2N3NAY1_9PEZI|nr:hypothetical protein jhhlp_004233 [Lomentospora prolificans]
MAAELRRQYPGWVLWEAHFPPGPTLRHSALSVQLAVSPASGGWLLPFGIQVQVGYPALVINPTADPSECWSTKDLPEKYNAVMEQQIPLSHEASAGDTHKQTTTTLPPEVVQCLENARFLHLATCFDNVPHVSLMNYTYLAESPFSTSPVIIMTTNPASKKINNLIANPNVSLLVHDWVSHRPPTGRRLSNGSPQPPTSSLASLLLNLNSSAMSSISATINGSARLADAGSDEERFYREQHLENNTFDGGDPFAADGPTTPSENPQRTQEDVRVVVVDIKDVRISDWKGGVRDWVLVKEEQLVNGVR